MKKIQLFLLMCLLLSWMPLIEQNVSFDTFTGHGIAPQFSGSLRQVFNADGNPVGVVSSGFLDSNIATGNTSFGTFFYFNDGAGAYSLDTGRPFMGVFFGDVHIVDLDGKNSLDHVELGGTVVGGNSSPKGEIIFSQSDGGYADDEGIIIGLVESSIAVADYDGDGDNDIWTEGVDENGIRRRIIYQNGDSAGNDTGNFSIVSNTTLHAHRRASLQNVDYDNDGDMDVLATGEEFNTRFQLTTVLWENQGAGNLDFTPLLSETTGLTNVGLGTTLVADFDGDGFVDVLPVGELDDFALDNTNDIHFGNGDGTFEMRPILSGFIAIESTNGSDAKAIDADNDGDLDIVIAGSLLSGNNVTRLYLNDGLGNLTLEIEFDIRVDQAKVLVVDVNRDGQKDIIATGNAGDFVIAGPEIGVFINTTNATEQRLYYEDADNDGLGDPMVSQLSTTQPEGFVDNKNDNCPTIASTDITDTDNDGQGNICDDDDDDDGTADIDDAFPLDASESVDTDGDGIGNNADPDDDNDGYLDADEVQCGSNSLDINSVPADADADFIPDCIDMQNDTDTDGDGILNDDDNCPDTPNPDQADFDNDGIGDVCDSDIDGDEVMNDDDNCSSTRPDVSVNASGCEVIRPGVISGSVISETCQDENNGSIEITSTRQRVTDYNIHIVGTGIDENHSVSSNGGSLFVREGLAPGLYEVSITIDEILFTQNLELNVLAIENISNATGRANSTTSSVSYSLQPNTQYTVTINQVTTFNISDNNGELIVAGIRSGDSITIETERICQGKIQETIFFEDQDLSLAVYPNPTVDRVYVRGLDSGLIQLMDISGNVITADHYTQSGIDMSIYPQGIYVLFVYDQDTDTRKTFKILKQ